jgi:hypothetical protein
MRKILSGIAALAAVIGINVGFIKILIFLYHEWHWIGIAVGVTFVPPILICPIWQWIATGHYVTFLLVYVLGFGGYALSKFLEE